MIIPQVELQHYESRLLKLRHLRADHVSNIEKHKSKVIFVFFNIFIAVQKLVFLIFMFNFAVVRNLVYF